MKVAVCFSMAGLVLIACAARAAEPVASDPVEAAESSTPAHTAGTADAATAGAAGMRAYIDPVTGELTDGPVTREQRAQAEDLALPGPDYSKVTLEPRADGSVIAHANGQFESSSTIQIDDDGKARTGCSQTGRHADHAHTRKIAEPRP